MKPESIIRLQFLSALLRSLKNVVKPKGYRTILQFDTNAKTVKGQAYGFKTGILYLAPADSSGIMNVCLFATTCKDVCLAHHGRGTFPNVRKARFEKTQLLAMHRALFLACLRYDIERLIRHCARLGVIPVVRVNGTSDLAWLGMQMAAEYPLLQMYDYTKLPKPELRVRPNYHLTYSYSGLNLDECLRVLARSVNVSVVFSTRKGQPLPETWNGYPVIDGDEHDLRFLDGRSVVVGLRAKGYAKKTTSPFVVPCAQPASANQLIRIAA